MNERLSKAKDLSIDTAKILAKTSFKTLDITLQIVREYNENQRMRALAGSNTKLEHALRGAGGYLEQVPGGITFDNTGTVKSHNILKRYTSLNYAADLALKATNNYPAKKIGPEVSVKESDSLAVITKPSSVTIQPKNSSKYVVTRYSNPNKADWNIDKDEWIVMPEPYFQPQTEKFCIDYIGKNNTGYASYDSNYDSDRLPNPMGSGSYESLKADEYTRLFGYIDDAAREISQLAYDDLVFQGNPITDELQSSLRLAQTYNLSRYQPHKTLFSIILNKVSN